MTETNRERIERAIGTAGLRYRDENVEGMVNRLTALLDERDRERGMEGFQGALHEISDALFDAGVTAEQWEPAEARICNALALLSSEQSHDPLALAARVVELEDMLKTCREAIHSLPQDSLGVGKKTVRSDDGQAGLMTWPIRDELVSNITTALSSPSPAVEAVREVLRAAVRLQQSADWVGICTMFDNAELPPREVIDLSDAVDAALRDFPALVAGLGEG